MELNSAENFDPYSIQLKKSPKIELKSFMGDAFSLDFKKELQECVDLILNDITTARRIF